MQGSEEVPRPPRAPEIERSFRLHAWQWVAIPLIMLVPALALLGVFGESWDTTGAATADLEVELRFPSRFRYKQLNEMHAFVRNVSGRRLDTVTVSFDTTYISRFSTVIFTPSAVRAYEVELTGVSPGEQRLISVELQGEKYGRHTGAIAAWGTTTDTVSASVSTFIFP